MFEKSGKTHNRARMWIIDDVAITGKGASEPLVTPKEAVNLADFRGYADLYIVSDIYQEYMTAGKCKSYGSGIVQDFHMNLYLLCATMWNAGRVQGIREERTKRKKQEVGNGNGK